MQDRYGVPSSEDLGISGCCGVPRCFLGLQSPHDTWRISGLGCSESFYDSMVHVRTAVKTSARQQCLGLGELWLQSAMQDRYGVSPSEDLGISDGCGDTVSPNWLEHRSCMCCFGCSASVLWEGEW